MNKHTIELLDVGEAEEVEIVIRKDKKVVWVNIDGMCRLCIYRIKNLVLSDESNDVKVKVTSKTQGKLEV